MHIVILDNFVPSTNIITYSQWLSKALIRFFYFNIARTVTNIIVYLSETATWRNDIELQNDCINPVSLDWSPLRSLTPLLVYVNEHHLRRNSNYSKPTYNRTVLWNCNKNNDQTRLKSKIVLKIRMFFFLSRKPAFARVSNSNPK